MKYDFIGIKELSVFGVKNPTLYFVATTTYKQYDLKIIVDNKEKKYNIIPTSDTNSFILQCDLGFMPKVVKIYFKNKEEKNFTLIHCSRTNIIRRGLKRIASYLKVMGRYAYRVCRAIYKGMIFFWKEYHFIVPLKLWKKYFNDFKKSIHRANTFYDPNNINQFNKWLSILDENEKIQNFKYNPLISVITPVYNADKYVLSECINSVLKQTYKNFELILVDDKSTNQQTIDCLNEYSHKDDRIKLKFRKENGHISRSSNDAIAMAKGEYIALLDNDDTIDENALYEVVKVLNSDKSIDMIYSDEDKIGLDGKRCYPHFKPDYSPDTLLGLNYICHFTVLRRSIVNEIGGFEIGLEGAQDHDLFLKFTEQTNKIYHIPKILYHWRMSESSTAMSAKNKDYANDAGFKAVTNALKRRKVDAEVTRDKVSGYFIIDYKVKKDPLISIIICTRDYADTLEVCLKSIYKKTSYKNYEVIVANNDSKNKETFDLFNKYKKKYKNFSVIDVNTEFNFSYINNVGVKNAKGEYIVLLNNDTEVITPNWLDIMIGYASQNHIGAVGPKLLYPDMTVQHAGVIMGLGGVASHAYIGASREDPGIYGRMKVPYNYSAVTAACVMIKKSKFLEVGGLEENLKVAYNDIDFCLKLVEKGYYNLFLPSVELIHFESKSRGLDTTKEKYERFIIESNIMYDKWNKYISNDPMYNLNFSKKGWFLLDKKHKGD